MTLNRRQFLKVTGSAAAGVGLSAGVAAPAEAAQADVGRTTLPYLPKIIGRASQIRDNMPGMFSFPDASSPCAVVKIGTPVPGGVGPNKDIVAYSTQCTHMGCPVSYDAAEKIFKCSCHFSIFDAEKSGQMVCGQATENLPVIVLEYNPGDDTVRAVAVEGLIYGRQSNML